MQLELQRAASQRIRTYVSHVIGLGMTAGQRVLTMQVLLRDAGSTGEERQNFVMDFLPEEE